MQSINNFIREHKSSVAISAMILMLVIIGISIWLATTGGFGIFAGGDDGGKAIDETYDPISHQTYENIDQEPEGKASSDPVYLGFGPLLDYVGEDAYYNFVEQANKYASDNFPDAKYVSLSEESLKRGDGSNFTFTIYFDSANPVDVSLTPSGSTKFSKREND